MRSRQFSFPYPLLTQGPSAELIKNVFPKLFLVIPLLTQEPSAELIKSFMCNWLPCINNYCHVFLPYVRHSLSPPLGDGAGTLGPLSRDNQPKPLCPFS
jgi:hypothetical protein